MKPAIKRIRPPMPLLAVRVQVAERQLRIGDRQVALRYFVATHADLVNRSMPMGKCLALALKTLGFEKPELHHSPALILRKYNPKVKNIAARYEPNANDADSLVYLEAPDHQQCTTGRRPGAERTVTTKGSDVGLKAKFNRLEGRTKPRTKAKIAQRKNPWPKRKLGK